MRTQEMCAKGLNVKFDILHVFDFQQSLLCAHCSGQRYNLVENKKHVVPNAFFSKKSSSVLLALEQQASKKSFLAESLVYIFFLYKNFDPVVNHFVIEEFY